eukprot:scaffold259025_cov34-Tisochrysis_lutea.AAC.6
MPQPVAAKQAGIERGTAMKATLLTMIAQLGALRSLRHGSAGAHFQACRLDPQCTGNQARGRWVGRGEAGRGSQCALTCHYAYPSVRPDRRAVVQHWRTPCPPAQAARAGAPASHPQAWQAALRRLPPAAGHI